MSPAVNRKSEYLRHLPAILWEDEPPLPEFSLGSSLRVFEKILDGLEDDIPLEHAGHPHAPIRPTIDTLQRLFDPWTTPSDFLPWLASWVSLEFSGLWDEYQRRKVTSTIVGVYARRGLHDAINDYLDLYTVAATRPRIAVDDSSKLLWIEPLPGRPARVHTLVSQEPLIAPLCIALAPDGSLIVGDDGTPDNWPSPVAAGVWRLDRTGGTAFAGTPPAPSPLPHPTGTTLSSPAAVACEGTPQSWRAYVLDKPRAFAPATAPALWRYPSSNLGAAPTVLLTRGQLGITWPIALAFDLNGRLLVLDRGAPLGTLPAQPRIVDVNVQATPAAVVATTNLPSVIEPVSLTVRANGDLIVGDAREQVWTGTGPIPAGNLVRVDRSNPAAWTSSLLLPTQNPLAAPSAVVESSATELLVLDLGLKPYRPSPGPAFEKDIAEPAALWRIGLGGAAATVQLASERKKLVYPLGMVRDEATLYVADRGEWSDLSFGGPIDRAWRAEPSQFGVVVHWSRQRPASLQQRRQIVHNIVEIVEVEKPAHTIWTVMSAV